MLRMQKGELSPIKIASKIHQWLNRQQSLIKEEQKAIATLIEQNQAQVNDFKFEYSKNYQVHKTNIAELGEELGQVRNLATVELARLQQKEKADFKFTSQELEILQNSVAKLDSLSQKLEQEIHTIDYGQSKSRHTIRMEGITSTSQDACSWRDTLAKRAD